MDFDINSQPQQIKEFFYTTKDFLDFIKSSKKRSLDILEKKIILQRKLWGFKKVANDITTDSQIPSETLAETIFFVIPLYNEILNELSAYKNPDFDLISMDVYALTNELTCVLANIRSKGNLWNYQATANLLVKILLGLPKHENVPDPPSIDNHDLNMKFIAQINSITTTSAVYTNVISVLINIPLQELCNWATAAFWHFNLQFEMYNKMYPTFQTLIVNNDWDQITHNILFLHTSVDLVRILAMNLQAKLGTHWDIMIKTFGVLPENSLKGIELLIERLQKNVENTLDIIFTTYKKGLLSVNTDPAKNPSIINLMNLQKFYIYNRIYLKLLEFLFFHNEDSDKSLYEKQFYEFLEKSYEYTQILETTAGGREQIFKSIVKNEYIDIITQRIEILALYTKIEHSLNIFDEKIKDLQWLIDAKSYELFPDFYLKYYLVLLTLYTEHSIAFDADKIFEELGELRENLTNSPRDYIVVSILLALLDNIVTRNTRQLERYLDEAKRKGISEGGQFHLEENFIRYSKYLKDILESETDKNDSNQIFQSTYANLFATLSSEEFTPIDSITWLIPKFKKINSSDKEETIFYIPFNRAKDAII